MAEKMPDSTRPGMTSSSYNPASVNGDDFAELVWQNGQILVQTRGPSSNRQKGSSCIGYSENPSHDIGYDEDVCITERARLNTSSSLFPASHKNFDMDFTLQESQQSNNHQCYQFNLPFAKSKNSFKNFDTHLMVEDECPDFRRGKESGGARQLASCRNSEFCSSSSEQCPASASFTTPRIPTPSCSQKQKQELRTVEKVNFPNFARPREFFKSTNQGNRATNQTNSAVLAGIKEIKTTKDDKKSVAFTTSKATGHSVVNDSSNKGSRSLKQEQTATNANQVPLVTKSSREPLPSRAMGNDSALRIHEAQDSSLAVNRAKGKPDTYLCDEQLVPSSPVCSFGASNDPTYLSIKHEVEDTFDSAYSSENDDDDDEEEEEPPREGARGKRSRKAEILNLSEKKRRDKIKKKMRALKELIPNCNKMDKASMLDDAIEHLKTLKLQLQIMSLGTGMCMPFMMLPAGANHLNPLHLTQFPQLGAGIAGLRPSTVNLPEFPPPQLGPASLPGITDNRLQIPGFPSQILPMSIPHAPFIPVLGKPFTQPVLSTSTPSNLVQHLASSPLPTLKDPVPNTAELNAQPAYVQYK